MARTPAAGHCRGLIFNQAGGHIAQAVRAPWPSTPGAEDEVSVRSPGRAGQTCWPAIPADDLQSEGVLSVLLMFSMTALNRGFRRPLAGLGHGVGGSQGCATRSAWLALGYSLPPLAGLLERRGLWRVFQSLQTFHTFRPFMHITCSGTRCGPVRCCRSLLRSKGSCTPARARRQS